MWVCVCSICIWIFGTTSLFTPLSMSVHTREYPPVLDYPQIQTTLKHPPPFTNSFVLHRANPSNINIHTHTHTRIHTSTWTSEPWRRNSSIPQSLSLTLSGCVCVRACLATRRSVNMRTYIFVQHSSHIRIHAHRHKKKLNLTYSDERDVVELTRTRSATHIKFNLL